MTASPSLSELIRQAQQTQPDELRPETGLGLDRAADTAREARAAAKAALAILADEVRLAVSVGMTQVEAAQRAGVTRVTVSKWVKEDNDG